MFMFQANTYPYVILAEANVFISHMHVICHNYGFFSPEMK